MYINKDIDFIIYTYDDFNTIYVSLKMQYSTIIILFSPLITASHIKIKIMSYLHYIMSTSYDMIIKLYKTCDIFNNITLIII